MTAPPLMELPLDDALLKVLSSDSRREILRLLLERRMTGAEMAVRLELGKPAVAEHLKKLLDAELIQRFDDDERRWVYYALTPRGRSILEPQRVRFYLVLGVAVLGLLVGLALALTFVAILQPTHGDGLPSGQLEGAADGGALGAVAGGAAHQVPDPAAAPTVQPAGQATTPTSTRAPYPVYQAGDEYNPVPVETAPNGDQRYILGPGDTLPAELLQRTVVIERADPVNHTFVLLLPANQTLASVAAPTGVMDAAPPLGTSLAPVLGEVAAAVPSVEIVPLPTQATRTLAPASTTATEATPEADEATGPAPPAGSSTQAPSAPSQSASPLPSVPVEAAPLPSPTSAASEPSPLASGAATGQAAAPGGSHPTMETLPSPATGRAPPPRALTPLVALAAAVALGLARRRVEA